MKAITITITEELDVRAGREAQRRGLSKSELIRQGLEQVLPSGDDAQTEDPWQSLSGFGSPTVTVSPGEIDDVLYGG